MNHYGQYRILGLASGRVEWFGQLAQWSTSGALPIEFTKCISLTEVRHLASGLQSYSALLVDAAVPGLDRDTIDELARRDITVIVVGNHTQNHALSGDAALSLPLQPSALLDVLTTRAKATPQPRSLVEVSTPTAHVRSGAVVAICGAGGVGTSVVASALAQGLGNESEVVLADFARNAQQAMLHDALDTLTGIEDLVEAHRSGSLGPDQVRDLTVSVSPRPYQLLAGQRRASSWTTMPPLAVAESLKSLAATFDITVVDITADFETEDKCGSLDVEERNALALQAVRAADVVLCVGTGNLKGIHSLGGVISSVSEVVANSAVVIPVINFSPRSKLARTQLESGLAATTGASETSCASAMHLRGLDLEGVIHDGAASRWPDKLTSPLVDAVLPLLGNLAARAGSGSNNSAQAIAAGTLGNGLDISREAS